MDLTHGGGGDYYLYFLLVSVSWVLKTPLVLGAKHTLYKRNILSWFPPWAEEKFVVFVRGKRNSNMSLGTASYGTVVLECSQLKLSHSQNITLEERPEKIPDTQVCSRSFHKLKLQFPLLLLLSQLHKWFCTHCLSPLCCDNQCLTQSFQMKRLGLKFPHGTNFIWESPCFTV